MPPQPEPPIRGSRFRDWTAFPLLIAVVVVAVAVVAISLVLLRSHRLVPIAQALTGESSGPIRDADDLKAAIARARGGETLLLEPGRYDNFALSRTRFATPVILASRNSRQPAILTGFKLHGVEGLVLRDMVFDVVAANGMLSYNITGCTNIGLSRINIHGSLDGDPSNDMSPVMIRGSDHVSIADSDFQQVFHGISFLNSTNLSFTGNAFHDVRTDGIRGGGSSNIVIRGNVFTRFKPNAKDHPDGVQLWTTQTTVPAHDILIEGNIVVRGDGGLLQGIFIRDETDHLPFENLTIRNNIVLGAMFNGIAIGGSKGGVADNNVVAAFPDQKSWLRVGAADGLTLTGNRATRILISPTARVEQRDNREISPARDGGKVMLADWLKRGDNARLVERPLRAVGLP